MSIDIIKIWHEKARPNPVNKDFQVQLGCHLEEIGEMLDQISGDDDFAHALVVKATVAVYKIAEALKSQSAAVHILDRCQFLDSLADQIVTSTGVGHCARMNLTEAVRRVNDSNWTKTVNGEFVRDMHGKIQKPEGYKPPDLTGLY
jgi:predicted HAD superfamily Cof-like phosphohydrolase